MKTIHISELLDYPLEACPYCDEYKLYLEFDETEMDGTPTDFGVHVHCKNELDVDDPNYDPRDHAYEPYIHWLPVEARAYKWACQNIRITWESESELRERWQAFERGDPIKNWLDFSPRYAIDDEADCSRNNGELSC
jgi:hypothetical protein